MIIIHYAPSFNNNKTNVDYASNDVKKCCILYSLGTTLWDRGGFLFVPSNCINQALVELFRENPNTYKKG